MSKDQETTTLLTTTQAAEMLMLSPRTLEGWRTKGAPAPGLPFMKLGRSVRYQMRDVVQFQESRMRRSTSAESCS